MQKTDAAIAAVACFYMNFNFVAKHAKKLKVKNEKLKIMSLKILKAHVKDNNLILDEVQLEGKKPVSFDEFVRGYPRATLADEDM